MENKENVTKETNEIQKVEKQLPETNNKFDYKKPKFMNMEEFHNTLLNMIVNADVSVFDFLAIFEKRKEYDVIEDCIQTLLTIPEEGDKEQYNCLYNAVARLMYKILIEIWYKNKTIKTKDFEYLTIEYFKKQAFFEISSPDTIEIFINNLLEETADIHDCSSVSILLRTVFLYITNTDVIPKNQRTLDKALELLSMMYTSGYDEKEESEFDKLIKSFVGTQYEIKDKSFLNSYVFSKKIQIDIKQRSLQICASKIMEYINMNGLSSSTDSFIIDKEIYFKTLEVERLCERIK